MKDVNKILDILEELYPDARCELEYTTAFELLIATILSAQCTDVRVNIVTRELFKKYNEPADFANLSEEEIIAKVDAPSWENSKKVICLNTNTIYNSITEGARKEQASRTSITRCCCNECQYVHTKDGRLTQWMFYNDYLKIKDLENQNMESEVY